MGEQASDSGQSVPRLSSITNSALLRSRQSEAQRWDEIYEDGITMLIVDVTTRQNL